MAFDITKYNKEVRELITSLSTGLNPSDLQTLANLVRKHDLNDIQYQEILGYIFTGEKAVSNSWNTMVKGLASGSSALEAKGLAAYKKALDQQITPERASALAKSLGLPANTASTLVDLYKSGTAKELLQGTQNPEQALLYAAQAAQQITSNSTVNRLANSVPGGIKAAKQIAAGQYVESWRSLDTLVLSNLDPTGEAGKTYAIASGVYKKISQGVTVMQKEAEKYNPRTADASGILVAGVTTAQQAINGAARFAVQLGANPIKAEQVVRWTSVGTGCIAGIVAGAAVSGVGAVAGAATCAVSVVSTVLDTISTARGQDTKKYLSAPAAIFTPSSDQLAIIATDGVRLLRLLRFVYKQPNYADFAERLKGTLLGTWLDPAEGYTKQGPTPGIAMGQIIPMLDFSTGPSIDGKTKANTGKKWGEWPGRVHLRLPALDKQWGHGDLSLPGLHVRDTYGKAIIGSFVWGLDTPPQWIDYWGPVMRGLVKRTGVPLDFWLTARDDKAIAKKYPSFWRFYDSKHKVDVYRFSSSAAAIYRAYEILQFFKAVVYYDLSFNSDAITPFYLGTAGVYGANNNLPVRLRTVGTNQTVYFMKEEFDAADSYSPKCWTNYRGKAEANARWGYTVHPCAFLDQGLQKKEEWAVRDLAFIRMLAAFSYIHTLAYKQTNVNKKTVSDLKLLNTATTQSGDVSKQKKHDILANLPDISKDPLGTFTLPVNPRARVVNGKLFVPSWKTLFIELRQRKDLSYAIRKATIATLAKGRKVQTVNRTARALGLDRGVVGRMIGIQGAEGALRILFKQLMTRAAYVKKCTAARGKAGVARNDKILCCPSVLYSENKKKCAVPGSKCHADCVNINNYAYGIAPVVQMATGTGYTYTAKQPAKREVSLVPWAEYQKYLMLLKSPPKQSAVPLPKGGQLRRGVAPESLVAPGLLAQLKYTPATTTAQTDTKKVVVDPPKSRIETKDTNILLIGGAIVLGVAIAGTVLYKKGE